MAVARCDVVLFLGRPLSLKEGRDDAPGWRLLSAAPNWEVVVEAEDRALLSLLTKSSFSCSFCHIMASSI